MPPTCLAKHVSICMSVPLGSVGSGALHSTAPRVPASSSKRQLATRTQLQCISNRLSPPIPWALLGLTGINFVVVKKKRKKKGQKRKENRKGVGCWEVINRSSGLHALGFWLRERPKTIEEKKENYFLGFSIEFSTKLRRDYLELSRRREKKIWEKALETRDTFKLSFLILFSYLFIFVI